MVHHPCPRGWTTLRESLPPPLDMNATITFEHVLQSNGIDDALWLLRVLGPVNEQAEAFVLECIDEIVKLVDPIPPEDTATLLEYVERNRERVLRTDYLRIDVAAYWSIAGQLPNKDTQIALFRKHFCTPGVTYGPTYPAE